MQDRFIDELTKLLSKEIPDFGGALQQDIDQHIRTAVGATLNRLDVVTREEFDVQRAVLERTREKLEQLRLLEHGLSIQVVSTIHKGYGVDRPEDIAVVEDILQKKGLN